MPINDSNTTTGSDRAEVVVTDETSGYRANVGTKTGGNKGLHVIADIENNQGESGINYFEPGVFRWEESGVAKGTTLATNPSWTTLYSYSGTGFFHGAHLNFNSDNNIWVRVYIDGVDMMLGSTGIFNGDIKNNADYDIKDYEFLILGIRAHDNTMNIETPVPIKFTSSVIVYASTNAAKAFQRGLFAISKVT